MITLLLRKSDIVSLQKVSKALQVICQAEMKKYNITVKQDVWQLLMNPSQKNNLPTKTFRLASKLPFSTLYKLIEHAFDISIQHQLIFVCTTSADCTTGARRSYLICNPEINPENIENIKLPKNNENIKNNYDCKGRGANAKVTNDTKLSKLYGIVRRICNQDVWGLVGKLRATGSLYLMDKRQLSQYLNYFPRLNEIEYKNVKIIYFGYFDIILKKEYFDIDRLVVDQAVTRTRYGFRKYIIDKLIARLSDKNDKSGLGSNNSIKMIQSIKSKFYQSNKFSHESEIYKIIEICIWRYDISYFVNPDKYNLSTKNDECSMITTKNAAHDTMVFYIEDQNEIVKYGYISS